MSEIINRTEFENLMDEYLRGELSESKRRAFENFVGQHPEARQEMEDVRGIIELTVGAANINPPVGLAEQAAAPLQKQLVSSKQQKAGWFRRPVFAWSLAASLLVVIGLTLWPTDSTFVYARLIENLKKIESVKVDGWIRGENGAIIPYRQWVISDGTLRAELGDEGHQRIVVLKGNERLIRDFDGQLFHDNTPVKWEENLEDVLSRLQAVYQSPNAPQSSYEYSKEDLGDAVRYQRRDHASLGGGPSNRKWIMEVDKQTALPTLLQLHQQIDGRWTQIFDLRFIMLDTPPAENHFVLEGTRLPLTEKHRQRFWFELFISPASIQLPAIHVPDGGLQLYWPTEDEMPAGISGGSSAIIAGGITNQEYRNLFLEVIVESLTGHRVLTNEISRQRVSLLFHSKTFLPWEDKLDPVLNHLGLEYEIVPKVSTQRRYIFEQDGKVIQTTLQKFENSSVSGSYKYHFEKTQLKRVILSLLVNCNNQNAYTENDTIEFFWDGSPEDNPFLLNVDLDCEIPNATFETNVEFLKEHFGLNLEIEEEKTENMEILLKKE
jgi:hypothetical protein